MIRPEMHEPLDERLVGLDRPPVALVRVRHVVLACEPAEFANRPVAATRQRVRCVGAARGFRAHLRGRVARSGLRGARGSRRPRACARARLRRGLARLAKLPQLAQHACRFRRMGRLARRAPRGLELLPEPAARIVADRGGITGPGAEAESIRGDRRFVRQHRGVPVDVLLPAAYRDQRAGRDAGLQAASNSRSGSPVPPAAGARRAPSRTPKFDGRREIRLHFRSAAVARVASNGSRALQ